MTGVLLLAQDIVAPDQLAKGDGQTILAWVVAALVLALVTTVSYLIKREGSHREELKALNAEHANEVKEWSGKRDKDHKKMMRLALRTQKSVEVWAGIEDKLRELDDHEDEDED